MKPETNASRAYQHLRQKLVSGDFEPGTRLLYGPIGKEIGVSATPVREAAGQLAKEGFVDLVPQIGAVVRSIDVSELKELYEVRQLIEPHTAALAAERASHEQLAAIQMHLGMMRDLTDQQRSTKSELADKRLTARFNQADHAFHIAVIEGSNNRALVRTATQSHVLTQVFGIRRHQHDADIMLSTCEDHQKILDAIISHDPKAAHQAAFDHVTKGLSLSLKALHSP
ncbi:GntR family transcriptional regulator [Neorhodopirellula pilleata]|uniref:HTH-type transcriptional repressor CsiR n=1 Tax=Neorhodopirellula pilleata TaxID=2714738 RepID=A0A5C5ZI23_9BACT|nr:GntR family transcriptional regulator [Neorhodopirellula pilleata]TWT86461.1 HTH-type transcriptional repressor CsiR [Neorhodopirellula pilleata]